MLTFSVLGEKNVNGFEAPAAVTELLVGNLRDENDSDIDAREFLQLKQHGNHRAAIQIPHSLSFVYDYANGTPVINELQITGKIIGVVALFLASELLQSRLVEKARGETFYAVNDGILNIVECFYDFLNDQRLAGGRVSVNEKRGRQNLL